MFRLKDQGSEAANNQKLETLKRMINELKGRIPGLLSIEAGINVSTRDIAHDLVLVSEFGSDEDLQVYRVHPEHMKVVEFLKEIKQDSAEVDYYFN
jgi:hypothetical protein